MHVPSLTYNELMDLLKSNGWKIVSDDHWEEFDRIMLKKGKLTVPIQIRKRYFFAVVVKICIDLNIEPPEDHYKFFKSYNKG